VRRVVRDLVSPLGVSQWALNKPTGDAVRLTLAARDPEFESGTYTFGAFVRASAIGATAGTIFRNLVNSSSTGRVLRFDSATALTAFVVTSSGNESATLSGLPSLFGAWHLIWASCDGTTLKVGVDTVAPAETTLVGTLLTSATSTAPALFNTTQTPWQRQVVGDIKWWFCVPEALNAQQIASLANNGGAINPATANFHSWLPTPGPSVLATGAIGTDTQASYTDGQTFTLIDALSAAYVFEIDVAGDGVTAGNVQVDISGDTTADNVRDTMISAINGTAILTTASDGGAATVTLTADRTGTLGNSPIDTSGSPPGSYTAMTGGAGGDLGNPGRVWSQEGAGDALVPVSSSFSESRVG